MLQLNFIFALQREHKLNLYNLLTNKELMYLSPMYARDKVNVNWFLTLNNIQCKFKHQFDTKQKKFKVPRNNSYIHNNISNVSSPKAYNNYNIRVVY